MEQSKQKIIKKILSFSYEELSQWMHSRLHGYDRYFSIHVGHETNLRGFLADAFNHIDDEEFRDNFIKILNELIFGVNNYSAKEIENSKEYIYELFTLLRSIKKFEDKNTLFEIAKSGKFKRFHVHDTDLHLVLLTTLSSYRIGGNYQFWIDQMQDNSNKYYTNAAFYALLDNGYSLDILFKHVGTFIDRFKGGIELVLGIESLFDDHEPEEIFRRFKCIQSELTVEQQEAVDNALIESGYDKIFKSNQDEYIEERPGPIKEDKDDWRTRREAMIKRVSMAIYSPQYWHNAAKVLSVHSGPGMKPETRAKLEWLAQSPDPETRSIAKAALKKL